MGDSFFDAVIVGGGPAGLTAAIYLARARYRALVIEKEKFGGQINITSNVVNYPGVESGSGREITEIMRRQAQSFGAEFLLAEALDIDILEDIKKIKTTRGEYEAYGIILATGANPKRIGFTGEKEFKGRGVAYCSTCDGEFFTGMDVFVAGGGFSAIQEAVFLTKYAREVNILVRGEHFKCPRSAIDEAKANPKIKVYYQTVVEEVSGDALPRHARFRNLLSGETWEYRPPKGKTFGVFVFAGYEPATGLVKGKVELSEAGYIITDENKKTSMNGVYAAGDVCVKSLRQLVTAVSDGAVAAAELEKHAAAMQKVSGRIPSQPVTRLPAGENREEAPAARPADPILPDSAGKTASAIETASQEEEASSETEFFFSPDIRAQLDILFTKMERPLILRASLDKRPVSAELRNFLNELAGLSDKLSLDYSGPDEGESAEEDAPCVRICREDGSDTGLAFHGVPGGHEFNAFAIGLYNAAGPGQSLDGELLRRIRELPNQAIQILVSLSCTLCPELVMAAQRIAVENPGISADVYDLNHFPDLKDRYKVMSVPCLVVNARALSFGKKNINELLEILNG